MESIKILLPYKIIFYPLSNSYLKHSLFMKERFYIPISLNTEIKTSFFNLLNKNKLLRAGLYRSQNLILTNLFNLFGQTNYF